MTILSAGILSFLQKYYIFLQKNGGIDLKLLV